MEKSQRAEIIKHLKKYGSISSKTAFERYGITRLSDIIFKLRGKGYVIVTIPKTTKNRYQHRTDYALYKLKKEPRHFQDGRD